MSLLTLRTARQPRPAPRPGGGRGRGVGVAALALLALAAAGCGSSASQNQDHFGEVPVDLLKNTLNYRDDTVLTGTVRRPALTRGPMASRKNGRLVGAEGRERRPGARRGLAPPGAVDDLHRGVTMFAATGPVPISTSDFTSIDAFGNQVYQPGFVPGQPRPPEINRPA